MLSVFGCMVRGVLYLEKIQPKREFEFDFEQKRFQLWIGAAVA